MTGSFLMVALILVGWVLAGMGVCLLFMFGWIRFQEHRDRKNPYGGFIYDRERERLP